MVGVRRLLLPCAAAAGLVLLAPAAASAHPGLIPPTVPAGVQTSLTVAVPSEPPAGAVAMTGIDIALPAQVTALAAQAGSTFSSVTVDPGGHEVHARGGTIPAVSSAFVVMQIDATAAGSYQLVVTAIHDNGATTVWDGPFGSNTYTNPLVVTHASSTGLGISTPTLVGGSVLLGGAVLAGSYEVTRRRRRRVR